MRATVTISIEVDDLGDLERVTRIVEAATGGADVPPPAPPAPPPPAPPDTEKPPPKKTRKKKAATVKAAPAPLPDAPEEEDTADAAPSSDDLAKAVKGAIEAKGIEAVRSAFATFKSKAGSPCLKMSDVKPGDYAAVIAALEA